MILCCGEALIDMIPAPTATGRDGYVPHPGGAVFNTAIALGRLGIRAGLLTGLSRDMFGRQLADALAQSRVDPAHLILSDRPSTLAFVHLADGHATYSFFDENSAGRMLTPADLPEISPEVSALYFGGISLACEPGADAYAALMARAAPDRAAMIDPNIRPGFIADPARFRARLDGMLALAEIVKVSDEDLNWIEPGPASLADKVAALQARGPALVILTRGSEGATGYLAGGTEVNVPSQRARVVDTVGAGDTFNAGVLASLSEQGLLQKDRLRSLAPAALEAALTLGTRVAAITVSRAGADAPWADEL